MFRIEQTAYPGGVRDDRIVDETRDAELRLVRGVGGPEYYVFRLTSKGRSVPILAEKGSERRGGADDDARTFIYKILEFGEVEEPWMPDVDRANEITFGGEPPYRFESAAERSELLLIAAEALLCFGHNYSGFLWADGIFQVVAEIDGKDRAFRLSDFGYPGRRDVTEPT